MTKVIYRWGRLDQHTKISEMTRPENPWRISVNIFVKRYIISVTPVNIKSLFDVLRLFFHFFIRDLSENKDNLHQVVVVLLTTMTSGN